MLRIPAALAAFLLTIGWFGALVIFAAEPAPSPSPEPMVETIVATRASIPASKVGEWGTAGRSCTVNLLRANEVAASWFARKTPAAEAPAVAALAFAARDVCAAAADAPPLEALVKFRPDSSQGPAK